MRYKLPISKIALTKFIERLRLEPGDILVVRDHHILESLEKVGGHLKFTVPLVFAPNGIQTLKREDLLNLLEQLESPDKSVLPDYHTSAPL